MIYQHAPLVPPAPAGTAPRRGPPRAARPAPAAPQASLAPRGSVKRGDRDRRGRTATGAPGAAAATHARGPWPGHASRRRSDQSESAVWGRGVSGEGKRRRAGGARDWWRSAQREASL